MHPEPTVPDEDAADRSGRLSFLQLDEAARARLQGLQPELCHALPGALQAFYSHLRRDPALARMLGDDAHVVRLSALQERHWADLLSGQLSTERSVLARRMPALGWSRAGTLAAIAWCWSG